MTTTTPIKQSLSSRYWLFKHTRGWPYQLADLAYQNDSLDAINQYGQQEIIGEHGSFAVLFDSHTGYQCEWPVLDDNGDLISSDEELQQCLKKTSEDEGAPYTTPFAHVDKDSSKPLRHDIKKHLQKIFNKRYFVFVQHVGWASPGMFDLMFTSDSASLPHLRVKARQACGPDMCAVIFDTEPGSGEQHKFVEIERIN